MFPPSTNTSKKPVKIPKPPSKHASFIDHAMYFMNHHVTLLNNSKLFAGIMIIVLNIASRYVNLKLSKTVESYLKYTFSRDVLVFAITWMGTRDIYTAVIMTAIFIVIMDVFLNEEHPWCVLPESFTSHHIEKLDKPSDEDVKKAKEVLEKAKESEAPSEMNSTTSLGS